MAEGVECDCWQADGADAAGCLGLADVAVLVVPFPCAANDDHASDEVEVVVVQGGQFARSGTGADGRGQKTGFSDPSYTVTLDDDPKKGNNYREFFALGDNSTDSLDSRYWGSVKQYNLVGPAFISLWPFNSGHWGLIK